MKKLSEKFGSHCRYGKIKSTIHRCMYGSLSQHEFKEHWCRMLDIYDLHENASLYSDRYFCVPAYVRDILDRNVNYTAK